MRQKQTAVATKSTIYFDNSQNFIPYITPSPLPCIINDAFGILPQLMQLSYYKKS